MSSHDLIVDAEGKTDMGSGKFAVIFLFFINGWRLAFEARPGPSTVICEIGDGNTFGRLGDKTSTAQHPIAPTDYVYAIVYQATTGANVETATSGLTAEESQALLDIDTNVDSLTTTVATLLEAQNLTNEQMEAEHITDPVTGKLVLRNWTTVERWEADAWEDAAMTIPYKGEGLEAVSQLVQVDWPYTLLSLWYGETLGVTDTEAGNSDVVYPFDDVIAHMTEFTDGSDLTWLNAISTGGGGTSYVTTIGDTFTPTSYVGHKVYLRFKGTTPGNADPAPIDGWTTLVSTAPLGGGATPIVAEASVDTEWRDIIIDIDEQTALENSLYSPVIFVVVSNGATYAGSPNEIKVASMEYRIPNMTTDLWP